MQVATQKLRNTNASLGQVAEIVGYDSEAAFSRAFKKTFGVAPATWRVRTAHVEAEARPKFPAYSSKKTGACVIRPRSPSTIPASGKRPFRRCGRDRA